MQKPSNRCLKKHYGPRPQFLKASLTPKGTTKISLYAQEFYFGAGMLHHPLPSSAQLAFKFWSDFFHGFTIFHGIQNKKSFLCLLFTIYAYFLRTQNRTTPSQAYVEWTESFSGAARFVYTTGVGHIGGVEGLTRLWNVITFKRAKNIQIELQNQRCGWWDSSGKWS